MTLHADALATLRAWTPPTAAQGELQGRFVRLLERRDDAVRRSCFPDHLTCGALVVDHTATRVLLNLHGKARRWFAFGGHCEPGDPTLAAVADRECSEESGLSAYTLDPVIAQLDVHPVPFCDPRGLVHHLDVRFVAQAPEDAVHAVSDESLDVRWFPLDELPDLEPAMHDLIAIARARFAAADPADPARTQVSEPPTRR